MDINGAATVLGFAYFLIKASRGSSCTWQNYWPTWYAKNNILKVKHRFQINRHCKLQNITKSIIGCWKLNFDRILLTNCNNNRLVGIYRWMGWATPWQPVQFWQFRCLQWNRTSAERSGSWTTQSTHLATIQFGPGPGPAVIVRNHF